MPDTNKNRYQIVIKNAGKSVALREREYYLSTTERYRPLSVDKGS